MITRSPFAAGSRVPGRPSATSSLPTASLAAGLSRNVASMTASKAMQASWGHGSRKQGKARFVGHGRRNVKQHVTILRRALLSLHLHIAGAGAQRMQQQQSECFSRTCDTAQDRKLRICTTRCGATPACSAGSRIISRDAWAPRMTLNADSSTLLPDPEVPVMTLKPGANSTCWLLTRAKSSMLMECRYVLCV